ncbi:methyltransferase family protein [Labilibaculum euxinus]
MINNIENGYILSIIYIVVSYVPMLFSRKGRKRLSDFSWINKKGKNLSALITVLWLIVLVAPVFCKITDNKWLFSIGLSLFVSGLTFTLISYYNYFTTPLGSLISKGMYRFSRNPIYVSNLIAIIGLSILVSSAVLAIVVIIYPILQHPIIKEEERFCEERFGVEFEQYKTKTRRYI